MNDSGGSLTLDADVDTVAVYGLGKMGLPLAAVIADAGFDVIGVDVDPAVVETVNDGACHVDREPGLPELVAKHVGAGLEATTDGAAAAKRADVMIALVPTLTDEAGAPDLGPVLSVAEDIATGVSARNLVILESTVPPGTTTGIFQETLESSGLTAGEEFALAHCPERTSSGQVVQDLTQSYPKIVGGLTDDGTDAAAELYRQFNEKGIVTVDSPTAAEAVKVFEGIYRDVNIALANELAKACEQWGLDSSAVFEAANSQPYCDIHDPGVGVGGHCIPVYPHFVIDRADDTALLETARLVNESMPAHTVARLEELLEARGSELDGARVLVLGLTYRAGVRELRNAPAVDVVELLEGAGATALAHDPLLEEETIESVGAIPVESLGDVDGLDGVVLATGHEEYRDLDLTELRSGMRSPALVDGRNFFTDGELAQFDAATVGGAQRQPQ